MVPRRSFVPVMGGSFFIIKIQELMKGVVTMRVKDTLNLGRTKFPMRGKLPVTEAQIGRAHV